MLTEIQCLVKEMNPLITYQIQQFYDCNNNLYEKETGTQKNRERLMGRLGGSVG